MHAVQQPIHAPSLKDKMGTPAWKTLPSWYLIATDDEALPPAAQHLFAERMGATVVEVASEHVAMVSHPDDTANLIVEAGRAVAAGAGEAQLTGR